MSDRPLWERLDGETSKAYQAFRAYRDVGVDRTIERAAETAGTTAKQAGKWSRQHRWRERAEAWDDELARVEDDTRLQTIRTMYEDHRRTGRAMIAKALRALQEIPDKAVPASAAARLLELGLRTERGILTTTPEELAGLTPDGEVKVDPWQVLADELTGTASP